MQYTQLTDRILPLFQQEYGHLGKIKRNDLNGLHFEFFDKEMGVICFRNLKDPAQRRGSGFAYVLIDELTEVPKSYFGDILYFRLQRGSERLPFMPFGAATNPDGIGHSWVKKLWVKKDFRGDDADFVPDDFIFVPALPDDNPAFSEEAFTAATAGLPEHVRRARRTGSWDAPEGARWPMLDEGFHLFEFRQRFPFGLPSGWTIILGVDYGIGKPYCCLWIAIDSDKNLWVFREDYRAGLTADMQAADIIKLTPENETIRESYLDPAMWSDFPSHLKNITPTDISAHEMYEKAFRTEARFGPIIKPSNDRLATLSTLDAYFVRDNGFPNIFIEVGCINLWSELTGATFDRRPGVITNGWDIDPRLPDHAIDALRYASHSIHPFTAETAKELPTPETARTLMRQEQINNEVRAFERSSRPNRF